MKLSSEKKTSTLKSTPEPKLYCEWCLAMFPAETAEQRELRYKEDGNMCPACSSRVNAVFQGRLKERDAIKRTEIIRQHNVYNAKKWRITESTLKAL